MQTNKKMADHAENRDCGSVVEERKECDRCSPEKSIPSRGVGCDSVAGTDDTADGADPNLPASPSAADLEDTIDLAFGRKP